MISEFYVVMAVIAVGVVLFAVLAIACFVELRKRSEKAGDPGNNH
jgi:hypothetical protein